MLIKYILFKKFDGFCFELKQTPSQHYRVDIWPFKMHKIPFFKLFERNKII
jgi:hypothetical protein